MIIKRQRDGTFTISGVTFGKVLVLYAAMNALEQQRPLSGVRHDVALAIRRTVDQEMQKGETA